MVELAPQLVVAGSRVPRGLMAPKAEPSGVFRETCPHCRDVPLMLVLRKDHVIRTHLFCQECTRCFDLVCLDGGSALAPAVLPIY
ncbi:MAG: hypothetical protein ACOYNZ_08340 [Rhodoferax sp.]